jgi:hypothetical protein
MFDCQSIQQSTRADAGLPITCVRMVRKDVWHGVSWGGLFLCQACRLNWSAIAPATRSSANERYGHFEP